MLNVLPESRKLLHRHAYIAKELRILTGIAIVATSLSVILVFVSSWVLQRWLDSVTASQTTEIISTEDRASLKQLVANVTTAVNQAQPLLANEHLALNDVQALLAPTPSNIQLQSFDLNYTNHVLTLNGTAATRDDLISYQQLVTSLPGITNLKAPLNDLNQKTDIAFTFTATYETPTPETTQ